ncbi:tRNA 4-thiouridine(8) synthase ThiI [Aliikangiella marina]|uniref:Probable tRNA sulfurtransferase n=1 Tax=Aliikangiella marina TaxID=1712262 RepID=A0A545TIG4_9GAMM|nr:tRNA uracil 4-sulfurtransferase ThiI [Aliikangiella marina]TQV77008.1 tRNA 4-thiouridine(8) synthase ThiI [Aliikangiella marina]
MKFVIKLFPEIIVKSRPVRKRFISQLKKNLRKLMLEVDESIIVGGKWDFVEVRLENGLDHYEAEVLQILKNTPGIDFILKVKTHEFDSLEDIVRITVDEYKEIVKDKYFCVRAKRAGKHTFSSTYLEQQAGGALLQNSQAAGVNLKNPDVTVNLEIKDNLLFTVDYRVEGLGGYPMGQQEACLSLISGGFDSSVASYLMIKRGIRTHYLFFNLGGMAHEVGVKQVAHYLWEKYSSTHRVLFITIPFENVVTEILTKVHHSQMGVILKRMMLRVAERVAEEFHIPGLVTGECVGQVSSQTMTNLSIIDQATSMLTMRPLITMDKQAIIKISRETGTEEFAASMPEYCGVISDKPTTKARKEKIEFEEAKFDFDVLSQAFDQMKVENIDSLYQVETNIDDIAVVSMPAANDVVIDIRHPQELAVKPLYLTNNKVLPIPFFKLQSTQELNKETDYLLYCDKGVMSQLQAEELTSKGYKVKVYQP